MKTLTDSERLEVAMELLSLRQLDEYAAKCEERENPVENYIAYYVNEELERNNKITAETIINAFDAYNGGAAD